MCTTRIEIRKRTLPLLLTTFSALYLLCGFNEHIDIYDEGICVYGAARVLDGDVPYRDFWSFYAPGQFYALAGLFALFGPQLIVARLFSIAVGVALSMVLYATARKMELMP